MDGPPAGDQARWAGSVPLGLRVPGGVWHPSSFCLMSECTGWRDPVPLALTQCACASKSLIIPSTQPSTLRGQRPQELGVGVGWGQHPQCHSNGAVTYPSVSPVLLMAAERL